MKNSITLSIPQTCTEKWSSFTPTAKGGWCGSCKKEVVDFTTMNDQQIIDYFNKSTESTCGRFQMSQLKTYSFKEPAVKPGWLFLKAGMLGLFLALLPNPSSALPPLTSITSENHILGFVTISSRQVLPLPIVQISGIVTSEDDGSPMVGVNIVLKGTTLGTVTNEKGQFQFERELREGDVLQFSFIGFATQEYVVPAGSTGPLTIVMKYDLDTMMMGEVVAGNVYVEPPSSGLHKLWTRIKNIF
ncbi:MAG: hypothetical protein HOP30_22595 [Cyclobacteriaceae bacterium]|nr:hypothetical protein [Cyclobacteriaceae bacterium]